MHDQLLVILSMSVIADNPRLFNRIKASWCTQSRFVLALSACYGATAIFITLGVSQSMLILNLLIALENKHSLYAFVALGINFDRSVNEAWVIFEHHVLI